MGQKGGGMKQVKWQTRGKERERGTKQGAIQIRGGLLAGDDTSVEPRRGSKTSLPLFLHFLHDCTHDTQGGISPLCPGRAAPPPPHTHQNFWFPTITWEQATPRGMHKTQNRLVRASHCSVSIWGQQLLSERRGCLSPLASSWQIGPHRSAQTRQLHSRTLSEAVQISPQVLRCNYTR